MERIRDAIQKARRAREGDDDFVDEAAVPERRGPKVRLGVDDAWANIPEFVPDPRHLRRHRVITMTCEDPAYTHFDIMRTKILAAMKQNGWKSLALTSPNPHCGKTMVSANLAFSLARQSELKTILIDVDLRRPQMAKTLGIQQGPSMSAFLSGTDDVTSQFVRFENNLAIGASSNPQRQSAELLANSQTRKSIDLLCKTLEPDIVIYDLPPIMASDDTLAFLPNVDCSLLIVEAERSTIREVDQTEQIMAEKSNFLGVVLNKCRFTTDNYGYYDY